MPTLIFAGNDNDSFGEFHHFNDGFDNNGSGEPIEWAVKTKRSGSIVVIGQYLPAPKDRWQISAFNINPEVPLNANWSIEIKPDQNNPKNPMLVINIHDEVSIICLQRPIYFQPNV